MTSETLVGNLPGRGYARVRLEGRVIAAVDVVGPERAGEPLLASGLLDLQLNGFAGVDFSDPALEAGRLIELLPRIWATGVTGFCPTLITNSIEAMARNLRVFEEARRHDHRFRDTIPCYHLEGPWFFPGNARGIHDPAFMHPPDWDEFLALQEAAGGHVGIVTLGPELPGAPEFISRLAAAGVVAAIGHTEALPGQIHAAVDSGARLSTHLGNGCPQMLDRHANPIWAQLTRPELAASIICDTFHLPPDLVQVVRGMKGGDGCVLITDATHVAGLPPGRYSIVGTPIELLANGKVIKADGACLAGSALTMNRAVPLYMRLSGAPLDAALRAATRNPAALIGRGLRGEIAPGAPAHLLRARFRPDGLEVAAVYLAGEEVYREQR